MDTEGSRFHRNHPTRWIPVSAGMTVTDYKTRTATGTSAARVSRFFSGSVNGAA